MAISYVGAGTIAYSTGSPAAGAPTGVQAGDYVIAVIGSKPAVSGDAWAGWDSLGGQDSGSAVAQGIDVGPTRISMRGKIWQAGDSIPALTITSNVTWVQTVAFRSATGNYALDLATGDKTTTGTAYSATMSGHHSAVAGDFLLCAICWPSDTATGTAGHGAVSAQATTVTGLTLSATTNIATPTSTLGQDIGGAVFYRSVSSGTATGAGTITATVGSATGSYGPAARLRIREALATVTATRATTWNVAGPAGITAGNSSTNAAGNTRSITLSPPAGVQQGDLLIAVIDHYISNDGTDNLNWDGIPAGWTTVAQQYSSTGQSNHLSMFWKYYDTADTTYTWGHAANVVSTTIAGGIQAYSGATATNISASGWPNTTALNFTTTAVTLTSATQWVVGAGGTYWGTSITWAARNTSTERIDRDATTDDAGVWLGDRAPGSTGSFGVEGTTGGAEGASAERCYISFAIDVASTLTAVTATRATTWNVASSTNPVTATRATTWNVSAPPAVLAVDASTPAMVGKTTTGTTLTTSSFTAPANSLIVAAVSTDWNDSQAAAVTLADTGGLTWTLRARRSRLGTQTPTGGTLGGGGVYIWTAVPTSATSRTVTATQGGGTGYAMAMDVTVYTYNGTDAPTIGDLDVNGGTGLPSATNTTTAATSWSWAVTDNFAAGGAATLGTGQTKVNEHHVATLFTATFWRRTAQNSGSGSSVTLNITAPSAQDHNTVAYEVVQPAPSTTPVTATRATTWAVAAQATGTRATTWVARAALAPATRATTWTVRTPVTPATRATTWVAHSATTGTRATTWVVRATATGTRATTWNVAGALTAVTATRATTWTTRAAPVATRATTWAAYAPTTGTRATTWAVRAPVAATRATTWHTLAAPAATRATTWAVRAPATATRSTQWAVLTPASATRATQWAVLTTLTPTLRATTWDTLAARAATRATTWDVASTQTTYTVLTNQTPTGTASDEGQGIALGLRFSSSTDGTITAIRYYLGNTSNAGSTLTVRLYADNNSTILASGSATVPSVTGWYEVPLDTPYVLTIGTSYRATAHMPAPGWYSYISGGANNAITNGPLTANAASNGGNGWWAYTATPGPATNTGFQSAVYMVDAVVSTAPLLTSVTSSRPTTWAVAAEATATRPTTWAVLANVTPSTRATAWTVRTAVPAATRATTWAVRGQTAATRATTWAVRSATTASRATTWAVRTTVTPQARTTTWAVLATRTATRATEWSVGSTIVSVTAQRATTWAVIGRIAATRDTTWAVLTPSSATRATTWAVRTPTTATRATTWAALAQRTNTRATTWVQRAHTTGTRATTWTVRIPTTPATRATTWDVLAERGAQRATMWATRESLTATRATNWDVHVVLQHVTLYSLDGPTTGLATLAMDGLQPTAGGPTTGAATAAGPAGTAQATMGHRALTCSGPSPT